MNSLTAKISSCFSYSPPLVVQRFLKMLIALGALTIVVVLAYRFVEHRYRLWKSFGAVRDLQLIVYSDSVDAHGDVTNRTYTTYVVSEKAVIKELWRAMDIYHPVTAPDIVHGNVTGTRPFALLAYPLKIDGQDLGFPIALYPDGTSFWGYAPEAEHQYSTPRLNKCVSQLLEELSSQSHSFRLADVRTEKPLPTFQEFINGRR